MIFGIYLISSEHLLLGIYLDISYMFIYQPLIAKKYLQMFEMIFKIQVSVYFSFFSNSGTDCYLHCSSETKVPVKLFNLSSLLMILKEILGLRKRQILKYS